MLSIVIPAHNEEHRISKTLEEYSRFFAEKRQEIGDFEILIVINACKDRTREVVESFEKRFSEIRHIEFEQGGKGFAIVQGFKDALNRADLIGFVDADMATPPDAFYDLVRNIKKYEGIIASRWLKKSKVSKQSLIRVVTSRVFNFIVRSLLFMPYKDTQCGAKIFKKEAIERVIDEMSMTARWAFDIDLLYKLRRNGFRIAEYPTIWAEKGGSKLNLIKVPFQMFSAVVRLRLIYSPFRFIVRAYNKLPEKCRLHNL